MAAKRPRKKQDIEKRRGEILKAALDVFTEKGYGVATMPDIAQRAGVAAGTLYLYYPSKRELFIAVIKDFIITPPLLKLIDKLPNGDINEGFKSLLKERLDLTTNEVFARIPPLIGEIWHDPEIKELWVKEFLQPFLNNLEAGYKMMMTTGKFRRLEPAVAVRAVGGMIMGFLMFRATEGRMSPLNKIEKEKIAEDIANLLLHGLLKGEKEDVK
jgi:AcrR family transcriptional regulator